MDEEIVRLRTELARSRMLVYERGEELITALNENSHLKNELSHLKSKLLRVKSAVEFL